MNIQLVARLAQVIVWTDAALVSNSSHFLLAPITGDTKVDSTLCSSGMNEFCLMLNEKKTGSLDRNHAMLGMMIHALAGLAEIKIRTDPAFVAASPDLPRTGVTCHSRMQSTASGT